MNDLATLDEEKDIETAANAFAKALAGISEGLSDKEEVLAKAVKEMAMLFVQVEQQRQIRAAVEKAHPHVQTVLDVLRGEIKHHKQGLQHARKQRSDNRRAALESLQDGFDDLPKPKKLAASQAAAKIVYVEMKDMAKGQAEDNAIVALEKAVQSCEKAHETLQARRWDVKAIGAFVGHARRAEALLGGQ